MRLARSITFRFIIAVLALCKVAAVTTATAQEISADQVSVSTPEYKAETANFAPTLGRYTYSVGWQGIPAAECTVDVEREGLFYRITTEAKTLSGVNIFYSLNYRAEGILSAVDFHPKKTSVSHTENSRQKITEVSYLDSGDVRAYRINHKGKEDRLQFNPNNFMLEPFSAAFLARSLSWKKGQSREFDTFNGKSRYLLKLTVVDEVTMQINGEPRKVWVIEPAVHNLTNPSKDKKLRSAQIYVTADVNREVLQIKSQVFIGSVFARLKSFAPSTDAKGPTTFLARAGTANISIQ